MKFKVGDLVIDTVTGFRGTITAVTKYNSGDIQYYVESRWWPENPTSPRWILEDRLKRQDRVQLNG